MGTEGNIQKFKWLPTILAVVALVAEMSLNIFGFDIHVVLYVVIVLFIVQILFMNLELEGIKNARPKLVIFAPPNWETRPLGHEVTTEKGPAFQILWQIDCFNMTFANNPKIRSEQSTARNVVAGLTYYDQSGHALMNSIFGRWGDTDQPASRPLLASTRDLLGVDIEANGSPRELNLAIKHQSENTIYAYNNDSVHAQGWKRPDFAINENRIFIHVRLTGENVDNTDFWVLLENNQNVWTINLAQPLKLST